MARRTTQLKWLPLALVTLVLAHELVFLVGYGEAYADALGRTGHDARWTAAVLTVLAMAGVLAAVGLWRLNRLGVLARALGAPRSAGGLRLASLVRDFLLVWPRLAIAGAILFVVQENLEHLGVGDPLPGFGVLVSRQYPNAGLMIVAVAFGVSLIAALFRWQRARLIARIEILRVRWRKPATVGASRPAGPDPLPRSILGRRLAVRAPPLA
jgi:hypothetical protein